MKTITGKQKKCIIKCKSVINDTDFGNPLDRINIDALTCYDASKIISGLLTLIKCNRLVFGGCSVSSTPEFSEALDNVYDTIDKCKVK